MTRVLTKTFLSAAMLLAAGGSAQAHSAGGSTDLAHGLDHVLGDPLHLLSLGGIGISLIAAVLVLRGLVRRNARLKRVRSDR